MKKKNILAVMIASVGISLCGCGTRTTVVTAEPDESEEKISFVADFYTNNGDHYLSVEGTSFSISPNKVKEYYYDENGKWTYHWAMSSIMSIDVNGKNIESCGSTVIFSDSRLERYDIDIPEDVKIDNGEQYSVNSPSDFKFENNYDLDWWWRTKKINNKDVGSKAIIIQSQNGDNICMYMGNEVIWDIPSNLPKTTQIVIDGMPLFVHRANFTIIDMSLIE